jgi:hypothetical protein
MSPDRRPCIIILLAPTLSRAEYDNRARNHSHVTRANNTPVGK